MMWKPGGCNCSVTRTWKLLSAARLIPERKQYDTLYVSTHIDLDKSVFFSLCRSLFYFYLVVEISISAFLPECVLFMCSLGICQLKKVKRRQALSLVQYRITLCFEASGGELFFFFPPLISFTSSLDSLVCVFIHFLFFCLPFPPTRSVSLSCYLKAHLSAFLFSCLPSSHSSVNPCELCFLMWVLCPSNNSPSLLVSLSYPAPQKPKHQLIPCIWRWR